MVLAGYARRYVVEKFKELGIPYYYKERCRDINSLYDCLDWYLVTSKFEGGPQSILESSYRKVKILSTPVGIAPEILHTDCLCSNAGEFVCKISQNVSRVEENYSNVKNNHMPEMIIPKLDDLFEGKDE